MIQEAAKFLFDLAVSPDGDEFILTHFASLGFSSQIQVMRSLDPAKYAPETILEIFRVVPDGPPSREFFKGRCHQHYLSHKHHDVLSQFWRTVDADRIY